MGSSGQDTVRRSFDDAAHSYESEMLSLLSVSAKDISYFARQKAEIIYTLFGKYQPKMTAPQVLDVGCGIGVPDQFLTERFEKICGIDLSEVSLELAKIKNPKVQYLPIQGDTFPVPENFSDLTLCIGALHHVPLDERERFVNNIFRATKPDGLCFVFEHNPWHPITRWIVSRCTFDKDANLITLGALTKLFLGKLKKLESGFIFFTPIERLFHLEWKCRSLPFGTQYFSVFQKAR